ncbi:hypothetical protein P43SY_007564 [Pythium insidiosum]|uniref:SET domain-containing protein n=1 Tax=Pythium insidiosum TaxID=114742 RepID=A0AAD5M3M6_PYTIN|nr:hypothetical protein P43SY_007564 [Pythium insidiosum]
MAKRRRSTRGDDRLAVALRVLLDRCSDLLCGLDGALEALAAACPSLARVVDGWTRTTLARDVSRGHERLPVPVCCSGVSLTATTARGLCCFRYAMEQEISAPRERHRLPAHLAAQLREHSVVQRVCRGRQVNLFVARTATKGWGVFAAQAIEKGEYIGEYTGEVISSAEMQRRYATHYDRVGLNYVLALRESTARASVYRTNVDATRVGCFTRLINHSCEPSLRMDAVRVDSFVPRLVLFTRRAVEEGEELTFDYGDSGGALTAVHGNEDLVTTTIMSDMKTYDQVCEDATSAAESRLLEHFKLYGGEVWTIGTGCQQCRKPLEDVSALKLNRLGLSTDSKQATEPKAIGVATSLQMDSSTLPGWFFTSDYESAIPLASVHHVAAIEQLVAVQGHLLLFSAWLQHPEPPATQSMPFEDRSFYGVIDSILQISAIRDAIDRFMDGQ